MARQEFPPSILSSTTTLISPYEPLVNTNCGVGFGFLLEGQGFLSSISDRILRNKEYAGYHVLGANGVLLGIGIFWSEPASLTMAWMR